jgi:hypothetical protein
MTPFTPGAAYRPLVTLLTDFGDADGYVGAMKGVILGIAPDAAIVDLAHGLGAGDILGAAFVWETTLSSFPDVGVHVAVVDPGVGTDRAAVAVAAYGRTYVAPDNGLLTGVLTNRPWTRATQTSAERATDGDAAWLSPPIRAVRIEAATILRSPTSATFHGRDVFAPAAAHLAAGVPLEALGPLIDPAGLKQLAHYRAVRRDGGVEGAVVHVDRFGNLRTNIPGQWLPGDACVEIDKGTDRPALVELSRGADTSSPPSSASGKGPASTFGDVAPGEPVAYIGSAGTLEVAIRDGSAARHFGVVGGAPVRIR